MAKLNTTNGTPFNDFFAKQKFTHNLLVHLPVHGKEELILIWARKINLILNENY